MTHLLLPSLSPHKRQNLCLPIHQTLSLPLRRIPGLPVLQELVLPIQMTLSESVHVLTIISIPKSRCVSSIMGRFLTIVLTNNDYHVAVDFCECFVIATIFSFVS